VSRIFPGIRPIGTLRGEPSLKRAYSNREGRIRQAEHGRRLVAEADQFFIL
jgi:hypothetical protein